MKVLLVHAHPEPASLNGFLRDLAVETLQGGQHQVRVSDLYAMNFPAALGPADVQGPRVDATHFKAQAEQKQALAQGSFAPEIKAEQEKLRWCDHLILQFPIYWFSMPAIMKGWVDRVFTTGFAYGGGGTMWYENGGLKGRRALVSMTTGAAAPAFAADGIHGDIDRILWPIHNGIMHFCGFQVLRPEIFYGVSRIDA